MRKLFLLAGALLVAPVYAQLSPEQRIFEFQNIVATYAKHYAPAEWKLAQGFDMFDLKPWVDRIREAKDDLEFHEICAEYVAALNDGHTRYQVPSDFLAELPFTVDIFDGLVLVEQIDRSRLPEAEYPFQMGDEVVSIDGKPVNEWIEQFSRMLRRGNPITTRRGAADLLTYRPQAYVPRASELGDHAVVEIRRASGETQVFSIAWSKNGRPYSGSNPLPFPFVFSAPWRKLSEDTEQPETPKYLSRLEAMRTWKLQDEDPLFQGSTTDADGTVQPRRYMLGLGLQKPPFSLPDNFVTRLGSNPRQYNFHYSGTFESGGLTIGYLRVPRFPGNSSYTVDELEAELQYMSENTDGLILDVMRNPGGGCYIIDLARHFMSERFYGFGEEIRVNWWNIVDMMNIIDEVKTEPAAPWVLSMYERYLEGYLTAYREGRPRTYAIPACGVTGSYDAPILENFPGDKVYTKPVVLLIDEFSISAADIFPGVMQDNKRALLVGMRTSGAGGRINSFAPGTFTMATVTNTASLVVRKAPLTTEGYPDSAYIENTGVHPDVKLDIMTRDNLMNKGKPFMDELTRITVDYIKSKQK